MKFRLCIDRDALVWLLGTSAFSLFLLVQILPTLGYYPPLTGDEAWIMSVAYKISNQGVFGSDWYRNLFDADRVYFIAAPVQHFLIAVAFRLLGESIESARATSLASLLVLLWTVSYLTRRWYGLGTALLTILLLTLWRSFFGGDALGLPLLSPSRSARYDLTALALIWLTLLFLNMYLGRPRRRTGFAVGLAAAGAALTQFFGIFTVPVIALALLWQRGRKTLSVSTMLWVALGFLTLLLPYAFYLALHWDSFVGQTNAFKQGRFAFAELLFYLSNLAREGQRYSDIVTRAFGASTGLFARAAALFSFLAVLSGVANLVVRVVSKADPSQMLLPFTIVIFGFGLALLDATKAPLYSIVTYPSLCVALALLWSDAFRWRKEWLYRAAFVSVSIGILAAIGAKAVGAFEIDRQSGAGTSRYSETVERVRQALPVNAHLVASDRIAWGLRDKFPLSTNNVVMQYKLTPAEQRASLLETLEQLKVKYLVLDEAAFGDFATDEQLNAELSDVVAHCTESVSAWQDASYGAIRIYSLTSDPGGCGP